MKNLVIFLVLFLAVDLFAADNHPKSDSALKKLEKKLRTSLPDIEPDLEFEYRDDFQALEIKYKTRNYKIHNRDKLGRLSKTAHDKTGPDYKGFILSCHIQPAGLVNQLELPQTITGPYWKTDFDVTKIAGTDKQIYWGLSYGSRTDIKTKLFIKQTLANLSLHDTPKRKSSLIWQDKKTAEVIFSADDIITFDWKNQQILLTLDSGLDFFKYCNQRSGQFKEFFIKDGSEKIMEARWVSPLSSMSFSDRPVYRAGAFSGSRLITIGARYDSREKEKLHKALKREGVLGRINEDPVKIEIETIVYPNPWQKSKKGISARVEFYPQTFRKNANARAHIFFSVPKDVKISDMDNISIWLTFMSPNGNFVGNTGKYLVSTECLQRGVYALEFNSFALFGDLSPVKENFGSGKARLTIEFQKDYNTIDKITFPEIEIPVTTKN